MATAGITEKGRDGGEVSPDNIWGTLFGQKEYAGSDGREGRTEGAPIDMT